MPTKRSKRELRLDRKIQKAIKNQDNNARLASSIEISSEPIRNPIIPDITNPLRIGLDETNYKKCALSWCISHADITGEWSWNESRQWSDFEYSDTIKSHFKDLENNTWGEIELHSYNGADKRRKLRNKSQALDSICKEAQERWLEDDIRAQFEELFRFRVGSKKRIWGIRVNHHFFLIWYERYHNICPVDRD